MKTVLIGAFAAALAAGPAAAATLVQNGSFELAPDGLGLVNKATFGTMPSSGPNWDVWTAIPGWTTESGPGIEVQTNRTLGSINAQDGNYYVELDSHPGSKSNSKMTQTVDLKKDGIYLLSFFYSPRDANLLSNDIGYSLGALVDGVTTGPVPGLTQVGAWTQITRSFVVSWADLGKQDLSFWAGGTENRLGGLIDNVTLDYVAPVPVPAAGFLMLGALGGLFMARRRRAA